MTFIWIVVISFSLLYILLIGFFYLGWIKSRNYKNPKTDFSCFVSIVIAARNEEDNILNLLTALSIQTYKNFEIIIIDDHSTDQTTEIIKKYNLINCNLNSLPENQSGKKIAIANAIKLSKGELILATDADCIPDKNWVKSMVSFYNSEQAEFIIGPVKQSASKNLFQQFFSLDFLSLQTAGAGSAEMKKPFICNGANIAFTKNVWENISKFQGNQFASGDDVFLLHNAINLLPKNKIRFIFSEDAMVLTDAPTNIKAFFNQRIRWASKAKGYNNSTSIITSLTILLINFLLLGLIINSLFFPQLIYCFLFVFSIKSFIDFVILLSAANFYKQHSLLWYFLPLQLIYFIYISIISIFSLFGKYKWKERNCE